MTADAVEPLKRVIAGLEALPDWRAAPIHEIVIKAAEALDLKLGKVAQPVRVAVAGKGVSPPVDVTLELLGRELTISRLRRAVNKIAT